MSEARSGGPSSQPAGVLRRAHIALFGSALGGALAVLNEVLCARYLGVNLYGLYAVALILARICEIVSNLGLPVGVLHQLSIDRDRGLRQEALGTLLAGLLAPLLLGLACSAVLWSLAPLLASKVFDHGEAVPFIRAMALAIPFMALSEMLGVITRAFGRAGHYVLVRNLIPPLVYTVLLLSIIRWRADAVWVCGAFLAGYLVATCVGVLSVLSVVRAAGGGLFRERPRFRFRALYAYSLPVLINNVLYLVIAFLPVLLLGATRGGSQTGIFRACMQVVVPFDMFVMAFNAGAGHVYPVLYDKRQFTELAALVRRTTGWLSLPALGVLLTIALNRHDFLSLMGPDFVSGASALLVLALGHAILCATGSAGFLLNMSGRQRFETLNAVVAATVCASLSFTLIRPYGALGAAAATTLACLVISVLRVSQVRRQLGMSILGLPLLRNVAIASTTALATLALVAPLNIEEGSGLASLSFRCLLIAGLFVGQYWCFGLAPGERMRLRESARGQLARLRRTPPDSPT